MGKAILSDTNAYSAFRRGEGEALEIIQQAYSIIISSTVLGKLLGGFGVGKRYEKNYAELREFLTASNVLVFSVNAQTATHYAQIYRSLRSKDKPIPTNDM